MYRNPEREGREAHYGHNVRSSMVITACEHTPPPETP